MSLFKKSNDNSKPEQDTEPTQYVERVFVSSLINLTDKMLRVELVSDEAAVKHGRVDMNGENIRIISERDILIAEIGKRSKAYAELEDKVGKRFIVTTIKAKQGDYGPYYQVKIKFEDTILVPLERKEN